MGLYTKNGRPLQVSGNIVYSRSGQLVGRINNDKVFDSGGRYVGTLVGDRLVYRSTDSAVISSPCPPYANRVGSAAAGAVGSAIWGDEPKIPD